MKDTNYRTEYIYRIKNKHRLKENFELVAELINNNNVLEFKYIQSNDYTRQFLKEGMWVKSLAGLERHFIVIKIGHKSKHPEFYI